MEKLTAIITAGNEETHIEAVLQSVAFADEIIVLDSYSTDRTAELAQKHKVRLLQREYDYPARQKNWVIPQATHHWILLLDADERITTELQKEITELLQSAPTKDAYWIHRQNYFMGKKVRYSGWQNDKVIRLFRKDKNRYQDVRVHEEIETKGSVGFLKNKMDHHTYRGLPHLFEKWDRYTTWGAHDRLPRTRKISLYHLALKPAWTFFHRYFIRLGILDGKVGFILASLSSYYVFSRSLKIWRLLKGEKLERE